MSESSACRHVDPDDGTPCGYPALDCGACKSCCRNNHTH